MMWSVSLTSTQHLCVVDAMQPTAPANSLLVHCLLESQEAFFVSGNNLLVACSEETIKNLMIKRIPRQTVLILSVRYE